jgi:hypothetical protein
VLPASKLRCFIVVAIFCSFAAVVQAQDKSGDAAGQQPPPAPSPAAAPATPPPSAQQPNQPLPDAPAPQKESPKRILGFIPNFQTSNDLSRVPKPLTSKEKFNIAWHNMFDVSAHIGNALQSGIQQASDGQPHYGQGWGAYGERFAAAEGDQITSSIFIIGVFPSLLHDDPRYFRRGPGFSVRSRLWYSVTRTVVTRKDDQTPTFNAPQVFGQLVQAGISNAYYPAQDRNIEGTFKGWGINLGYNCGYNLLKEFYPDFLGLFHGHHRDPDVHPPAPEAHP